MIIQYKDTEMELFPEHAIWLQAYNTLIISDLHLGKTTHFRKHGIVLPMQGIERDYMNLNALLERKQPEHVIIIGDLFHSHHNNEWQLFCNFVAENAATKFTLIRGNHDILSKKHYQQACITLQETPMRLGDLLLSHEPLNELPAEVLNLAGHVHPGYLLQGKGKQHLRLPCFFMDSRHLILPAFGELTGLQLLDKKKNTRVFVIAGGKVVEV